MIENRTEDAADVMNFTSAGMLNRALPEVRNLAASRWQAHWKGCLALY
jgi:hypothetical protein